MEVGSRSHFRGALQSIKRAGEPSLSKEPKERNIGPYIIKLVSNSEINAHKRIQWHVIWLIYYKLLFDVPWIIYMVSKSIVTPHIESNSAVGRRTNFPTSNPGAA